MLHSSISHQFFIPPSATSTSLSHQSPVLHPSASHPYFTLPSVNNTSPFHQSSVVHSSISHQCFTLPSVTNASPFRQSSVLHTSIGRQCFTLPSVTESMSICCQGLRMLDQPFMTDLIEANAMGHMPNVIDIYSASWGPTDDGKTVDGPRNLTMRAIVNGVNNVSILLSFPFLLKETWGFTSTETIKVYKGRGSWGGREFLYLTPTCYTVTTRLILH